MEVKQKMKVSLPKLLGLSILIASCALALVFSSSLLTIPAHAASQAGAPTDPNIKYVGRWDTSNSSVATSYWGGAYLLTDFTGKTVKMKIGAFGTLYVSIDHHTDVAYFGSGTINLTPTPLAAGTHTLRIAAEGGSISFQGLILSSGAKTVAPTTSSKLIEFVGDSVTAGATTARQALDAYGWLIGEQLKVQHTQIAQPGICLTDKVHCGSPNHIGMITQFYKLQSPDHLNSPNWDFSRYQANVVVINLGTNDQKYGVSDATFQTNYVAFLKGIRVKYPKAVILALMGFKGLKAAPTLAAVQAVNAAGDHNVHFVDTTGWLVKADFHDSAHPTAAGHMKVAAKLAPIISSYLG
jgi:lysophospholipase L1-like esterase